MLTKSCSQTFLWESSEGARKRRQRRRPASPRTGHRHNSPRTAPPRPAALTRSPPPQPRSNTASSHSTQEGNVLPPPSCLPRTPRTPETLLWTTALKHAPSVCVRVGGAGLRRAQHPGVLPCPPGTERPPAAPSSCRRLRGRGGKFLESHCKIFSGAEHLAIPPKSMEKEGVGVSARALGESTGEGDAGILTGWFILSCSAAASVRSLPRAR